MNTQQQLRDAFEELAGRGTFREGRLAHLFQLFQIHRRSVPPGFAAGREIATSMFLQTDSVHACPRSANFVPPAARRTLAANKAWFSNPQLNHRSSGCEKS